ncbi:MAG: hypothetical protein KDK36_02930 [Leptospiraceae bacterium]|nr:hypothetical protein [Leptospiraceae bacterium]
MKTLQLTDRDLTISNYNFIELDDENTLKQRIKNRLALFLGEFSLEPNEGMDWFTLKEYAYNTDEISKAVRSEILRDTEVVSINSLEVIFIDTPEKVKQYNLPKRSVLINWNLNTIYGVVTNG